jgi:hypothetical protein
MLRAAASRYIDDAGFTAKVLSALPPARRRTEARRLVLVLGATLLGTGITILLAGHQLIALCGLVAAQAEKLGALSALGMGPTITFAASVLAIAVCAGGWWGLVRSR